MQSNGIDMYDLVPNIHENNKDLNKTNKRFWVGVIEGMYPSPPVPRRKTKCYAPAIVYSYFGTKLFCLGKDFYKIPENEFAFIQ